MLPVSVRVIGVHLSGAATRRSAVVRGSFVRQTAPRTGLDVGVAHGLFAAEMLRWFGVSGEPGEDDANHLSANAVSATLSSPLATTPFFWEAYAADIGASAGKESDVRLLEALEDLGAVDVYCIDAPLTPPPLLCVSAHTSELTAQAVAALHGLWESQREAGRKLRAPQPYLDRWFENDARVRFEAARLEHGFEFEPPFSSNRAPISARAMWLKGELNKRHPKALVLESHSNAASIGWALAAGYSALTSIALKHGHEGHGARAGLLRRLEMQRMAIRSAGLHQSLFEDLAASTPVFFAGMAALSVWGFLAGRCFVTPAYATLVPDCPFSGWALFPRELERSGLAL